MNLIQLLVGVSMEERGAIGEKKRQGLSISKRGGGGGRQEKENLLWTGLQPNLNTLRVMKTICVLLVLFAGCLSTFHVVLANSDSTASAYASALTTGNSGSVQALMAPEMLTMLHGRASFPRTQPAAAATDGDWTEIYFSKYFDSSCTHAPTKKIGAKAFIEATCPSVLVNRNSVPPNQHFRPMFCRCLACSWCN